MVHRFQLALLFATVVLSSCERHAAGFDELKPLTASESARVQGELRAFLQAVARDVKQEGPIAWQSYFSDRPEFFMVVNGQIAFKDGNDAKNALPKIALAFKHIDLNWGSDLRVDPLTSETAIVAAPYDEVQVDAAGRRVDDKGYFTGVAQLRDGRWQFRDAHWSTASRRDLSGP